MNGCIAGGRLYGLECKEDQLVAFRVESVITAGDLNSVRVQLPEYIQAA